MLNRFQLGRARNEAGGYGCDELSSKRAVAVCAQKGLDWRFRYLDTTSFALIGAHMPDTQQGLMHMGLAICQIRNTRDHHATQDHRFSSG
jgi:hypothetical protein